MGALHDGHLSLVRASRAATDITVVTIFVNPAQFGLDEDLAKYPRPIEIRHRQLNEIGAEIVFTPSQDRDLPGEFFDVRRSARMWPENWKVNFGLRISVEFARSS